MKGVRDFFLISMFFVINPRYLHAETSVISFANNLESMQNNPCNVIRMPYDQCDSLINVYEQEPFAFTTSPLGYALRFLSRVFAELSEIKKDQLSQVMLHELCDQVLDISTLSDSALLYTKHQIALVPEKELYFVEELDRFVQKIEMLEDCFSGLTVDQELSPEVITIRVVLARIIKKIHEIIA